MQQHQVTLCISVHRLADIPVPPATSQSSCIIFLRYARPAAGFTAMQLASRTARQLSCQMSTASARGGGNQHSPRQASHTVSRARIWYQRSCRVTQ